jgi:hypothetical protein
MPWSVKRRGSQFCVVKDSDGSTVHCHASKEKALAQLRALYNSEPKLAGLDHEEQRIIACAALRYVGAADEETPRERWARWDAEHPREKHPREKNLTAHKEFDEAVLDGAVAVAQQKAERDIKDDTGPMAAAVWRVEHPQSSGYKPTSRKAQDREDRYLVGLRNGDPKAVAEFKSRMAKQWEEYPPSKDEALHAAIEAGAKQVNEEPAMRAAIERFGAVPIVGVERLGGLAGGRSLNGAIAISEVQSTRLSAPLGTSRYNIDDSMTGTIRHEYGHHVQSMLTDKEDRVWAEAHQRWGGTLGGPAAVDRELEGVIHEGREVDGRGVSLYGRTNSNEAFAETFCLVTHPDFDDSKVDPLGRPLVDAVRQILSGKVE